MSDGDFFRPRLVAVRNEGAGHDAERFRQVMLPHMDAAYNFARYLARNDTIAEDVVQEAFLRAFRSFEGWRGDSAKAWLLAIVRNCFHDHVGRSNDPLRGAEPVEAIDASGAAIPERELPDASAERNSDAAMLRRTIEALPEPFREALVLRELEERSYKEIAAITNAPIGTVMSRLLRARTMLASMLLPDAGKNLGARA